MCGALFGFGRFGLLGIERGNDTEEHLANAGAVSWWDLACAAASRMGAPLDLIQPLETALVPRAAPRPRYSALGSARGALMPALDDALDRYARDVHRTALEMPVLEVPS